MLSNTFSELRLSWRFVKPVRLLLALLVLASALLVMVSQHAWQARAELVRMSPVEHIENIYSLGSDEVGELGSLPYCAIETLAQRNPSYEFLLQSSHGAFGYRQQSDGELISDYEFTNVEENFIRFFDLPLSQEWFSPEDGSQLTWVYTTQSWWDDHQGDIVWLQDSPHLEMVSNVWGNNFDTLMVPIAGVVAIDVNLYQRAWGRTDFFASYTFSQWMEMWSDGSFEKWLPPSYDYKTDNYASSNAWVKTPDYVEYTRLTERFNEQLLGEASDCLAQLDTPTKALVLPGTRSSLQYYDMQHLNWVITAYLTIGLLMLVGVLTGAIALRLHQHRQREWLNKVIVGAQGLWRIHLLESLVLLVLIALVSPLLIVAGQAFLPIFYMAALSQVYWQPLIVFLVLYCLVSVLIGALSLKRFHLAGLSERLASHVSAIRKPAQFVQLFYALAIALLSAVVMVMMVSSYALHQRANPQDMLTDRGIELLIAEPRVKADDFWYPAEGIYGLQSGMWEHEGVLDSWAQANEGQVVTSCFDPTWRPGEVNLVQQEGSLKMPVPAFEVFVTPAWLEQLFGVVAEPNEVLVSESLLSSLNSSTLPIFVSTNFEVLADGTRKLVGTQEVFQRVPNINIPQLQAPNIIYRVEPGLESCWRNDQTFWLTSSRIPQLDTLPEISDYEGNPLVYTTTSWRTYVKAMQFGYQQQAWLVGGISLLTLLATLGSLALMVIVQIRQYGPFYKLNVLLGQRPSQQRNQLLGQGIALVVMSQAVALALGITTFLYQLPQLNTFVSNTEILLIGASWVALVIVLYVATLVSASKGVVAGLVR